MSQARKPVFFSAKVVEIFQQTFKILSENPLLWFLFLIIALLDYLALAILFFSHSEPVSNVLGPVIRTFWGSRFLHYPHNFVLLPKLLNHAHFLINAFLGVILTGTAIKMIERSVSGESQSVVSMMGTVTKKYFALFLVWVVSYLLFVYGIRTVLRLLPPVMFAQLVLGYVLSLAMQILFVFILPSLLISSRGFLKDIGRAFVFSLKNFLFAGAVLALPMFIILILSVLKTLVPVVIGFCPELVLLILAVTIPALMVVDLFVTTSTTLIFLKEEKNL